MDRPALLETLGVIGAGTLLGRYLRFGGSQMLLPMILGSVLQSQGVIHIELPPWLLAASYLLLGWHIGSRFTPQILLHAVRVLPQTVFCIVAMVGFCAGLAWLLVHVSGVDPLTAYLATSPGGADSVAIIAASSKVDMAFVMSLQIVRFLMILLIGPLLSRWLAQTLFSSSASGAAGPSET